MTKSGIDPEMFLKQALTTLKGLPQSETGDGMESALKLVEVVTQAVGTMAILRPVIERLDVIEQKLDQLHERQAVVEAFMGVGAQRDASTVAMAMQPGEQTILPVDGGTLVVCVDTLGTLLVRILKPPEDDENSSNAEEG